MDDTSCTYLFAVYYSLCALWLGECLLPSAGNCILGPVGISGWKEKLHGPREKLSLQKCEKVWACRGGEEVGGRERSFSGEAGSLLHGQR